MKGLAEGRRGDEICIQYSSDLQADVASFQWQGYHPAVAKAEERGGGGQTIHQVKRI